jgi:hypothetical protein
MMLNNRRIKVREIAENMNMSKERYPLHSNIYGTFTVICCLYGDIRVQRVKSTFKLKAVVRRVPCLLTLDQRSVGRVKA